MPAFSLHAALRSASPTLRSIRPAWWLLCFGLFWGLALLVPNCAADPIPLYSVTLEWDPNPEPEVAGYRLYYGTVSSAYTQTFDAGNLTQATVSVVPGIPYFFAVTAYDAQGFESDYSNEVTYTAPIAPALVVENIIPPAESVPKDGSPALANLALSPDGSLSFVILAQAGSPLQVEASSDMVSWTCLGVLENPTGGTIVTDTDASRHRRRYYRVVEPPPVE